MSTFQDAQSTIERNRGLPWGKVIGLPVTVGDLAEVSQEIVRRVRGAETGRYVCVANAHMLVTARRDRQLRSIVERASLVVSDGMPLVWRLHKLGFSGAKKVRGPELMSYLCRLMADENLPVYFYGGDANLIGELKEQVGRVIPGITIAGAEAAPRLPLRPEVDPATLERIKQSGARLVFVSLGCPKQEFWMQAYSPHLNAVLIGVGQAFSITAGQMAEAPHWMRNIGLEWLFRLVHEPRRLWRRYLVTNTLFIAYSIAESLKALLWRSDADPLHHATAQQLEGRMP